MLPLSVCFVVTLVLNLLWFGVAFHYFSLKHVAAAKMLVLPASRHSPLFQTLAASLRFLGGMNLGFAGLALLLLLNLSVFPEPIQRSLLLWVFALAHASQFYFNIPVARAGGRQGEAYWDVLTGPMRFIFCVDATLMVVNGGLALAYGLS